MKRAKEVGLRKVVGAERRQLVGQFFGESGLMTLIALLLALVLAKAALPHFNALTGKALTLRVLDPCILASLAAIGVLVGALGGTFPSLCLSSFEPAQVLKGSVSFVPLTTRGRAGGPVLAGYGQGDEDDAHPKKAAVDAARFIGWPPFAVAYEHNIISLSMAPLDLMPEIGKVRGNLGKRGNFGGGTGQDRMDDSTRASAHFRPGLFSGER